MRFLIALMLATLALAGCSDDAPAEKVADEFADFGDDGLQPTEDTGILRGVVVDEAVVPLPGVTITLQGTGLNQTTDDAGRFGFDGLEPGAYVLEASRLGYTSSQVTVEVVAGEASPEIYRIRLIKDAGFAPYSSTQAHTGFYQCGTSVLVVCGAPGALLPFFGLDDPLGIDSSTHTFYFDAGIDFLQVEMIWATTLTLSPALSFQVEALDEGCTTPEDPFASYEMGYAEGVSPLKATVDNGTLEYWNVNPDDCGAYLSVFAGDALDGAHCVPDVPCVGVGGSVEQEFEWFLTEFHDYKPPEDWWYTTEGDLPPPA